MNKPNSAVLDIINRAWEGIAPIQDECAKLLALPPPIPPRPAPYEEPQTVSCANAPVMPPCSLRRSAIPAIRVPPIAASAPLPRITRRCRPSR